MRRMFVLTMALAAAAAAPAAAQLLAGMPAWNSPKGGTGLTLSADYGLPNDDAGGGDAYGIRGSFGFSKFTIAAGYSGYEADGATKYVTEVKVDDLFLAGRSAKSRADADYETVAA